jgi:hypothetical protein
MTSQDNYTAMMKAKAAAGLALREGVDNMLILIDDSEAKREIQRMIEAHIKACSDANKLGAGLL